MGTPTQIPRAIDAIGGRYELLDRIGAGGAAEVWRARDLSLGRIVAVKRPFGEPPRDDRVLREAKALAAVVHPNVVEVYDYGISDGTLEGRPYIVMEYVKGPDLAERLRAGPLVEDEAIGIATSVLAGTASAHAAGVVHGDLKPANILLGDDGAKVGDFGVARIFAEETGQTTVAATPSYAAPEVLEGRRATEASDVYSVGCILFHMLTGRPPYEGTMWEVVQQHTRSPVPEMVGVVPDRLAGVLRRALAKDPGDRHPTAAALADDVDTAADPQTIRLSSGATAPIDVTQRVPRAVDTGLAVFFGRLAPVMSSLRERLRSPRRSVGALTIAVGLVILSVATIALLLAAGDGARAVVPDVEGQSVADAVRQIQEAGAFVDEVSYRPVAAGEPGTVVRTIPGVGEALEEGERVHVIASAVVGGGEAVIADGEREADDADEREDEDEGGRGRDDAEGEGRGNGREGNERSKGRDA